MTYTGYDGPDTVSKAMLDQLNSMVTRYSSIDMQIAAADGDRDSALKSWMETTDLAQAVKLKQTIANATAKLRELAESNVQSVELSDDARTKLTVEKDELKSHIKAGVDVLKNLIQNFSVDAENVQKALDSIENPVKSTRGRKPGTAGSSLPRASVIITITGGNFNSPDMANKFDSFSKVANVLNVEVKDLQLAFAKAAGVEHQDISSVNKDVEFEFTPNHPNASTYLLKTTPKSRSKPGPKTASSEPAENEETPSEDQTPKSVEDPETTEESAA